jgi:hypothetical protein
MATIKQIAHEDSDIQRIDAPPLYLRIPALLIDGLLLAVPTTIIFGLTTDGTIIDVFSTAVGFALNPRAFLMSVLLLAILEWLTGKTAGTLVTTGERRIPLIRVEGELGTMDRVG